MSINKENKDWLDTDWFDTHFEVISFDDEGQEAKETANKLKEGFRKVFENEVVEKSDKELYEHRKFDDYRLEELESRVCSCGKLVEDCDEAYEHATSGA